MRLIDADKAIEIWKEKDFIKFVGQEEKAKMLLDALPTEPRWIPCSERLPEDSRNVLITLSHYDIVVPGWYSNKKKIWFRLYQGRWAEVIDTECDVIAWHYFPKPYKEEGEDEE